MMVMMVMMMMMILDQQMIYQLTVVCSKVNLEVLHLVELEAAHGAGDLDLRVGPPHVTVVSGVGGERFPAVLALE